MRLNLQLQLDYEFWAITEAFSVLTECENGISDAKLRERLAQKNRAVIHKYQMVQVAKSKLDSISDFVVAKHNPAAPTYVFEFLTLEIESFLMMSRSLLDILSTSISIIELDDPNTQSFNRLRKRNDCPLWLKNYFESNIQSSDELPLRKRGWLSLLVSEDRKGQCLRDFVTHRGIADFQFRELPFEDGWDIIFKPRTSDVFALPLKDVAAQITNGINDLAEALNNQYTANSQ